MAIVKTIPIHSIEGVGNCVIYITNEEKTTVIETDDGVKVQVKEKDNELKVERLDGADMDDSLMENIQRTLDYAENAEKTSFELDGDEDILVTGHNCWAESATEEFYALRVKYEEGLRRNGIEPESRIYGKKTNKRTGELVDKQSREAYHLVMSFSERPDLSPQLVHRIGLEFCERALADTKAVVSTHMNTNHLHNHIVFSAYKTTGLKKYRDTMEQLKALRDISDEISLKYGLDIIVDVDRGDRSARSYAEDLARKHGTSWKELLKTDIKRAIDISSSWDEYVKVMTAAGYGVSEKSKSVTYYFLNDENKRVRDNKLGKDYSREFIKEVYGELTHEEAEAIRSGKKEAEIKETSSEPLSEELRKKILIEQSRYTTKSSKVEEYKEEENTAKFKKKRKLFVARYTVTGRRRSDLELLFLGAIKLINLFKDTNYDSRGASIYKGNPIYQPANIKVKNMQESLNYTIGLGIRDLDHLKELKNKCGAEKSALEKDIKSVESNLKAATQLNSKVELLIELQKLINARGLDNIDIMPVKFTDGEVQHNKAVIQPMTTKQRRDLFTKLDESGYRVTVKYDDISYKDCEEILKFIAGKTDVKPDLLISEEQDHTKRRITYYENMRNKRMLGMLSKEPDKPITDYQKKSIAKIMEANPDIAQKPKNFAEAWEFIGYFARESVYSSPLCDDKKMETVRKILNENGLTLYREPITEDEFESIKRYVDKKTKYLPTCLKESEPIKDYQRNQIEELLELTGIRFNVSVEKMTVNDYYDALEYLLCKLSVPKCISEEKAEKQDFSELNKSLNHKFETAIKDLSSDDQSYIYRYRTLVNELASYGISLDDMVEVSDTAKELSKQYTDMQNRIRDLNYEYRNYSRLEHNSTLAKNQSYTHGPKVEIDPEEKKKSPQEKIYEQMRTMDSDMDGISDFDELAGGTDMFSRSNETGDITVDERKDSEFIQEDDELEEDSKKRGSSFTVADNYFDL